MSCTYVCVVNMCECESEHICKYEHNLSTTKFKQLLNETKCMFKEYLYMLLLVKILWLFILQSLLNISFSFKVT